MVDIQHKHEPEDVSCEFESTRHEPLEAPSVSLREFLGSWRQVGETTAVDPFIWSGVTPQEYKRSGDDWAHVRRHVIVGEKGEATQFHVRYFEIAPGGHTTLEKHTHSHVIIGIRGRGLVIAGHECYEMSILDTLYVGPDLPHQLINEHDQPFGFFCLVDAHRDKPRRLSQKERETLMRDPITRDRVRFAAAPQPTGKMIDAKVSRTPLNRVAEPSDP